MKSKNLLFVITAILIVHFVYGWYAIISLYIDFAFPEYDRDPIISGNWLIFWLITTLLSTILLYTRPIRYIWLTLLSNFND